MAYIKFDKASSAARAIEVMHEAVLNEGRGPLLKVFLAEAPSSRYNIASPSYTLRYSAVPHSAGSSEVKGTATLRFQWHLSLFACTGAEATADCI